ncbi:WXG100 family type VII secretion target [Nocardia niigatensis]|uniref:WXG100 family type VII secretion target n=1 Tax=Nocardia niigatensis TaxID=209249 RepID=UPI0012F67112|nr:WXG100 family type VII secretion target [Nocardia niigatensis]
MAGRVQVDPDAVRDAAAIAGDIQARLQSMADNARSAVSPGTSGWGDDDFGGKFADGAKGFSTSSANMATGTENLANSFQNLHRGLNKSATRLENMEHGNFDTFA